MILKNISLLGRIWRLLLVRFAYSPTNFIFLLGRLIFSKSINTHPDNIYIYVHCQKLYNLFVCPLETSIKLSLLLPFLSCFAAGVNAFCIFWQCTYIVFILQCHPPPLKKKQKKTTAKLSKKNRNKCLYCYRFLS